MKTKKRYSSIKLRKFYIRLYGAPHYTNVYKIFGTLCSEWILSLSLDVIPLNLVSYVILRSSFQLYQWTFAYCFLWKVKNKDVQGSIKQIQKNHSQTQLKLKFLVTVQLMNSIKLNQFDLVQSRCINLDTLYFLSINKIWQLTILRTVLLFLFATRKLSIHLWIKTHFKPDIERPSRFLNVAFKVLHH